MSSAGAVIGIVGTFIGILVPLLMLGCILFLLGKRSQNIVSSQGRQLGIGMVISHFTGFGLFLVANAIPIHLQPIRVLVACIAILLLGVIPSTIAVTLIKRQLIPQTIYPFGWFVAGITGGLSLMLSFAVWIADSAIKATVAG